MRLLGSACLACSCLLLGSAWLLLRSGIDVAVPAVAGGTDARRADDAPADRLARLQRARRTCQPEELQQFLAEQRALARDPAADAATLRLLAAALLEHILLQNHHRGLQVGTPLYERVPPAIAAAIDEALELLQRARAAGDTSAENWRLEADLLGNRITGLATALQWNGRIEQALASAAKADDRDPRLHVSLGLRKLLAPPFFGHDPAAALQHFDYAAAQLTDDERPALFAAMAAWLQHKRMQAVAWLERATVCNPDNAFARAVLERVRKDEPDPFARDIVATATASIDSAGGK